MASGDSQVQEIKEKLPINEVIGQYVTLRRAGRNFVGRCPFHKERTPSFHVSPERNSYMCFGCGEKGDIFTFVEKIDGIDFKAALTQLAERAGVVLVQRSRVDEAARIEYKDKEERLLAACEEATKFFESKLAGRKEIVDYLHARGVKDETIKEWRLGYAPASWEDLAKHLLTKGFTKDDIADAGLAAKSERKPGEIYDRFRGRIMFPLADASGKVIAFSGRFFEKVAGSREEGDPAKYVNSSETLLFRKSKVLYGFDKARNAIRTNNCSLLVEGQFDVIMSHQSGYSNTIAISGTALTQEHLALLGRFSKNLILALDGDSAGIQAGLKSTLLATLQGFAVKIPTFAGGKDPADLAKENPELLKAAVRTSKPAVEFFLGYYKSTTPDASKYDKQVQEHVLPLIAAVENKIDQDTMARIFLRYSTGTSDWALRDEIKKIQAKGFNVYTPEPSEPAGPAPKPPEAGLTQLEHTVGMLLSYHSENDAAYQKIESLLGKERLANLWQRIEPYQEKLRFEFDDLGPDPAASALSLMSTLEGQLLEEEMKALRSSLLSGSDADSTLASKRLVDLKRRQQELRK